MKGVLLHGGAGTRLRPLTHTGPKQLIPVAGRPISQFCLEDMREAGVSEVAIILGSVWPEKVKEYYGNGDKLGIKIQYIYQGDPRGLAHAVGLAKDFVREDKFVVYLGDNLLKGGIASHLSAFSSSSADAMVLLSKVSQPERFGVASFDEGGNLVSLVEKPKIPPSEFALVGVYFFTPRIFQAIEKLKPSWRGELEITEAIQLLLADGHRVHHRFVEGWWKDTGTPQDILDANRLILDEKITGSDIEGKVEPDAAIQGRVRIEEGALIESGVTIRGPAYVGRETTIGSSAFIGPYTSIGNNCRISSCEVENSIVMDGCRINSKLRITDSLIGPETEILKPKNRQPKSCRLILGERSQLQL